MAQHDVAQFVRHHAGDFVVGSRRLDHAAIQEHRSAGQGERIDVALIHDVEGVSECRLLKTSRHRRHESRADPLDKGLRGPIVQHRQLLTSLAQRLVVLLERPGSD